jgi:exodeoxyribonuclease VII small subunit
MNFEQMQLDDLQTDDLQSAAADPEAVNTVEGEAGSIPAEMSFEEALAELDQVVRRLEAGEIGIEKSLELYSKGNELANFCARKLDEIEHRIARLTRQGDQMVELPFDAE